jgi:hypothetical protein
MEVKICLLRKRKVVEEVPLVIFKECFKIDETFTKGPLKGL